MQQQNNNGIIRSRKGVRKSVCWSPMLAIRVSFAFNSVRYSWLTLQYVLNFQSYFHQFIEFRQHNLHKDIDAHQWTRTRQNANVSREGHAI